MPKEYFNKEQFNLCLDFIERNMIECIEGSINVQPELKEGARKDLVGICNILNAIDVLRAIDYDDYEDEID
jgi:hypothetical protein